MILQYKAYRLLESCFFLIKKIRWFALNILFFSFSISSCKKSNDLVVAASLDVVNASPGVSNAKVRTPIATGYFSVLKGVNYGSNSVFNIPTGSVPISMTNADDTTKPFYFTTINCNAGQIYSYFISGASGEDIISNKDVIPIRTDSSFGLRFINLSYNSSSLNVTLSVSPTSNEFTGITYKTITDFKNYPAKFTDPSTYTFQALDDSGNLISTLDVTTANYVQKNITLVLMGMLGGSGTTAPGLFLVNNF